MKTNIIMLATTVLVFSVLGIIGCSNSQGPTGTATNMVSQNTDNVIVQSLSTESVVAQDLSQLSKADVVESASSGIFSIGWNEFVGPNIIQCGTIGKAFVVVHSDTGQARTHPSGVDIGTVTLAYGTSSSVELTKQTTPDGEVLYSTFNRGLHDTQSVQINIPFVANGAYQFNVTGSTSFSAGSFIVNAPPSLLTIASNKNGDSISVNNDLALTWSGGSQVDSVLIRIVPHLRPEQIACRSPQNGQPGQGHRGGSLMNGGPGGPPPMDGGERDSTEDRMPFNLGPEFHKGIIITVPNTGGVTISASDLQGLFTGTQAAELMVGVAQVIKNNIQHDNKTLNLLLRNGDSIVLKIK